MWRRWHDLHYRWQRGRGRVLCGALCAVAAVRAYSDEHLPDVVDRIRPSIVGVGTYAATRRPPAVLAGTGFVVGDGHLAATNLHVVARALDGEHKEHLVVFIGRGRDSEYRNVVVERTDEEHDLTLLRFTGAAVAATTLPTDAQATVREGTAIAFTGYPIGAVLGLYPVTHQGIVSALTPIAIPATTARELSAGKIAALRAPYDVIQLDATAYPGNSGSPVYRQSDGALVGIINQVLVKGKKEDALRDPSAITYAIPVRFLRALLGTADAPP